MASNLSAPRACFVQYTNPANYPPLEHGATLLSRAGWQVWFFGIESEGESGKLKFPPALTDRQTLWKWVPPGPRQKAHYLAFTLAAFWRVIRHRATLVYCSDLMSSPAALLLLKLTNCRVVYHEHDSPESGKPKTETLKTEIQKIQSGEQESANNATFSVSVFQRFLLWCRMRVGREADLVVLPNQRRLDLFVQTTGRRGTSVCVCNCPRKEEVSPPKGELGGRGVLRVAYHGSINRVRLPVATLEAMRRYPGRMHLSVVGYETVGSKSYMVSFLREAERLGLGEAVEFIGALPTRLEILQEASRCEVGLAIMPLQGGDVNEANMTGASNKAFDYLACGLALLVSARPDWEEMFVQPGYGLSCDPNDADSIATQLRWFLEHPVETRDMGKRGRQRILAEWNYERQYAPVLDILNRKNNISPIK